MLDTLTFLAGQQPLDNLGCHATVLDEPLKKKDFLGRGLLDDAVFGQDGLQDSLGGEGVGGKKFGKRAGLGAGHGQQEVVGSDLLVVEALASGFDLLEEFKGAGGVGDIKNDILE